MKIPFLSNWFYVRKLKRRETWEKEQILIENAALKAAEEVIYDLTSDIGLDEMEEVINIVKNEQEGYVNYRKLGMLLFLKLMKDRKEIVAKKDIYDNSHLLRNREEKFLK